MEDPESLTIGQVPVTAPTATGGLLHALAGLSTGKAPLFVAFCAHCCCCNPALPLLAAAKALALWAVVLLAALLLVPRVVRWRRRAKSGLRAE